MQILGTNIDNIPKDEVLQAINEFVRDDRQHWIATVNPEIVLRARKDQEYRAILNSADLRIADGTGIILASRFLGNKIRERITGVDLMQNIITQNNVGFPKPHIRMMIVGAEEKSRRGAGEKLKAKFANIDLKISKMNIDVRKKDKEEFLKLNEEINDFCPAILFVAFGAPYQEKWIYDNINLLPSVKLAIGVGGAIDMISGKLPRAPRFMRKSGLEWLCRLFLEPKRIGRIFQAVIVFPTLIIVSIFSKK